MNRTRRVAGIVGVLVLVFAIVGPAAARVGGGGSSGSRGSRSYSAPRTPSAPFSPAPRPSTPAPYAPGSSPRPGGLFGGFGGMLGGLLVGGLVGSLLFGHGGVGMGGGGIGLFDILLLAGLAALAIAFFRRRAPQPAAPAGYAGGEWTPRGSALPAPLEPGAPPTDDLAQGVAAIRMMDPAFDPARFAAIVTDLFTRLQIGWSAGDLASVRAQLTDEMAVALEQDLSRLKTLHRVNRVEQVKVESAEVTEVWQEYGRDLVTVRLKASVLDYTLDETTSAVVEGSRTAPTAFEEYWTFVRPVGPNPWRVSAIQQPPA